MLEYYFYTMWTEDKQPLPVGEDGCMHLVS